MSNELIRGDRTLKTIHVYIQEALTKVQTGEADKVSSVLAEIMPDVLKALHAMATSDESTQGQRKWALEAILSIFARLMTMRLREDRAEITQQKWLAKRANAEAARSLAKAQDKKSQLEISRERKRIQRQLTKVEQALQQVPEKETNEKSA